MHKRIALITLPLLAALTATTALANEPYLPRKEKAFNRLDVNADGKIVYSEFTPVIAKRFGRMDTNGDKAVTAQELENRMLAAVTKRKDRIMQLLDRNADGQITEPELDNLAQAMFNSADSDHDGAVTLLESQNFKKGQWRKQMISGSAN